MLFLFHHLEVSTVDKDKKTKNVLVLLILIMATFQITHYILKSPAVLALECQHITHDQFTFVATAQVSAVVVCILYFLCSIISGSL